MAVLHLVTAVSTVRHGVTYLDGGSGCPYPPYSSVAGLHLALFNAATVSADKLVHVTVEVTALLILALQYCLFEQDRYLVLYTCRVVPV